MPPDASEAIRAIDVLDAMIADTAQRLTKIASNVGTDWGALSLGESSGVRLATLKEARNAIRDAEMKRLENAHA